MDARPQSDSVAAAPLPEALVVTISRDEVVSRLETLARRGKLPDYHTGVGDQVFSIQAYGAPFDHHLEGFARQVGPALRITLRLRMLPKLPIIFALVAIATIWPGVWLTDSMLKTYLSWYDFQTWMWYLPLSILPLPWAARGMLRRSRESALASARETLAIIAPALGASVQSPQPKTDSVVGVLDPTT
ncbi:MAG: hypothetical protein WC718_04895 [Phycisphaerales bacterium]|jgi:hypothetical protein